MGSQHGTQKRTKNRFKIALNNNLLTNASWKPLKPSSTPSWSLQDPPRKRLSASRTPPGQIFAAFKRLQQGLCDAKTSGGGGCQPARAMRSAAPVLELASSGSRACGIHSCQRAKCSPTGSRHSADPAPPDRLLALFSSSFSTSFSDRSCTPIFRSWSPKPFQNGAKTLPKSSPKRSRIRCYVANTEN